MLLAAQAGEVVKWGLDYGTGAKIRAVFQHGAEISIGRAALILPGDHLLLHPLLAPMPAPRTGVCRAMPKKRPANISRQNLPGFGHFCRRNTRVEASALPPAGRCSPV